MTEKQKTLSDAFDGTVLRASDVKEVTGISYRQLNDWDTKGVLPTERKDKASWRKFGAREVFVLLICKELRDKFCVPLEKLGLIKSHILNDETDYFQHALELIAHLGVTLYLLTDLKESFMIETDNETGILFQMGVFRGSDSANYLLVKLNPLINKMLTLVGIEPCESNERYYEAIFKQREEASIKSHKEAKILRLIRDKKFRQVTIHLKDGNIIRADTEEELSDGETNKRDKELLAIINDKKYQSIVVKIQDGKIVRLNRSTPIKFDKGTEKS